MNRISLNAKRTGRTSRMLAHAQELANQGKAVYVVASTKAHASDLQERLGPGSRVKVEVAHMHGNFDWERMRLLGAHPNVTVLADHFAIERQFAAMLEMLHRYDDDKADAEYKEVPFVPTERQWGGLARDIMMWIDMYPESKRTPRTLFKHLEMLGRDIPQWLRDEPEMKNLDHVPSKGTRAAIIYRAMVEAA